MKNSKLYKIVKEEVKRHVQEAKGGTKFKCNDCGKKFTASLMNFGSRECPKCESPDTALVTEALKRCLDCGKNLEGREAKAGVCDDCITPPEERRRVGKEGVNEGVSREAQGASSANSTGLKKRLTHLQRMSKSELKKKVRGLEDWMWELRKGQYTHGIPFGCVEQRKDARVYMRLVKTALKASKKESVNEANDETDVHKQKGKRPKSFKQASAWDWRIHSKGSYWEFAPNAWGARAKSGQVDYFKDKRVAMKFADYDHKVTNNANDLYTRGSFKEGAGEEAMELAGGVKARLKKTLDKLLTWPEPKLREKRKAINKELDNITHGKTKWPPGKEAEKKKLYKALETYLHLVVLAMDTHAAKSRYGLEKNCVTEMATGLKVECMECGKIFTARSHEPKCPRCGGYDVDIA